MHNRNRFATTALFVCLILIAPVTLFAAEDAKQSDIPIHKIVIFSSGVGYFEHSGTVDGNATAELPFETAQINDILKSLLLEDLDGGHIGTVVYPSQDPLAKTLRSFQVDIGDNPSLGDLLSQLRGASVKVTLPGEIIDGVILGLELQEESRHEGEPVDVWHLNLLAEGTIRNISLNDARGIELHDKQLRTELNKALQAVSQARDHDKKPVTLNFLGNGTRRVKIGYVVETPIWKTSYRLVMPTDANEKARIQGWAIIENQTDNDWNDITLSLVSGRPISFIQNLYQPLYLPRPVVQPELYAGLTPQKYGAGSADLEEEDGLSKSDDIAYFGSARSVRRNKKPDGKDAVNRLTNLGYVASASNALYDFDYEAPINPTASVASAASTSELGELFQYTVPNVSLPRRQSAMIPIVTDEIDIERVSIYNPNVLPRNPLAGAILTNSTGKHLMGGPVTVLDDNAYTGDARIEDLPPSQHRLLSYAIDLKVHADASAQQLYNDLQTAEIIKGTLRLTRKRVRTREYRFDNKRSEDKLVIVEHALNAGWRLVDTPEPYETTDSTYRFKQPLEADGKATLVVSEERVTSESIAILPMDLSTLEAHSKTGEIPPNVRQVLTHALQLKRQIEDTNTRITTLKASVESITREQARIRSNMQTVNASSEYYARLMTKLNDQETQIENHQDEIKQLQELRSKQQKELEQYLIKQTEN